MATDIAAGSLPVSRRRARTPIVLLCLAIIGLTVIWLMPEQRLDLGTKRISSVVLLGILSVIGLIWFVALSRARGTTRLLTLLVALALVGAAIGSVRRVEFFGDMRPIVDWRWQVDRNAALESHRASQSVAAAAALESITAGPDDVLEYRGAARDGIVVGPALARSWDEQPPKKVWRQPVGGGYSAFVLVGPLAITIEQRRDREAVVAYDADTGAQRWVYDYPAFFTETLGGDGPRATSTVVGNRVYSLGATGMLPCVDLATGDLHWSTNILQDNQSGNLDWAMSGSPLIYDGLVVVNPGTQKGQADSRALVAYDAESGKRRWGAGTGKAGYASPTLATLAGKPQVLMFEGLALVGYDAEQGEVLWSVDWKSDYDVNAAQPILLPGDEVFITSAAGSALLAITQQDGKFTATEKWKNRFLKGGYACPIAYEGFVYGLDNGILTCLDLASGKRQWKGGRFGNGQMLLTGDLFVILSETGELALVQATPEKFIELGRMPAIEGRTWNNPTLRNGRIFIRNQLEMAAYDLPLLPAATTAP